MPLFLYRIRRGVILCAALVFWLGPAAFAQEHHGAEHVDQVHPAAAAEIASPAPSAVQHEAEALAAVPVESPVEPAAALPDISQEEQPHADAAHDDQPAPAKESHAENVDAVLVLDSSGSMLRTDPQRLRDQGVNLFVQSLNTGDRIGVVEFAAEARLVQDLTDFSPALRDEISSRVARIDNMGLYTDLLSGLKMALTLLEREPRADADRVIVLFSDGQMDPDPAHGNPNQRLDELIDTLLPKLKEQGIKLHTVALSELSDKRLLAQMSVATSGLNWYAPTADSIMQSFADLFLAVKKPQVVALTSKGFPIDDGVKEATFYINRGDSTEIALESPGGERISPDDTPSNVKWFRGEKFDVVTIDTPDPGDWNISGLPSSDSFATVLANLKLSIDFPSDGINSGDQVTLEARFFDARKPVSLPQFSGVVNYTYEIIPTDKVSEPVEKGVLHDDGSSGDHRANDGIFSNNIALHDEGEYRLTVTARGPTFVRQQQLPFRVRPRPISLTVEEFDESHAGASGGSKKEGEEEEKEMREYFVVRLSNDVGSLKNKVVKLRATDDQRKVFALPLSQPEAKEGDKTKARNANEYRAPVALPREGEYTLVAYLTAESKNRKQYSAQSNELYYEFGKSKHKSDEAEMVFEVKTEKKVEFPIAYYSLMIVANIGLGMFFLTRLRKSVAGVSVQVIKYEQPQEVLDVLKKLSERMALTSVDPSDSMYLPESIAQLKQGKTPLAGLSSAATSAEASEGEAAVAEQEASSEAPPPEDTPADATPAEAEPTTEKEGA